MPIINMITGTLFKVPMKRTSYDEFGSPVDIDEFVVTVFASVY